MSTHSPSNTIETLVLQSTPFCNIDCEYCYLPDRLSTKRTSVELIERVLESVLQSSFIGERMNILWHAGEPLTMPRAYYEEVFHRIETLNGGRCDIQHIIQTNGTLITQEWCDFFKAWNVGIGVSLDGPAFIHDRRRKTRTKKGTHAETMRGVSLLRANDLKFGVLAVITQFSLNFPDEFVNFFLESEIPSIGLNHEEVISANLHTTLEQADSELSLQRFMERVYQLVKESDGRLGVREFVAAEAAITTGIKLEKLQNPFTIINMDCDGNLTTFSPEFLGEKSHIYGDFNLGNIMSSSVEEMNLHPKFQRMMADVQAGVELCRQQCEYFEHCGGGDPAHKYYENGTFVSTETLHCKWHVQMPIKTILKDLESVS